MLKKAVPHVGRDTPLVLLLDALDEADAKPEAPTLATNLVRGHLPACLFEQLFLPLARLASPLLQLTIQSS